jgi:hypothetical protein
VDNLALLSGLALAGGCGEKMWITQSPDFYTTELKSIAVATFRNQTNWRGAGEIIADKLASSLVANGSYKVFNRNDLKTVMDESDLQLALGGDSAAAPEKLKKLTQVQAILVGTVTTYAATTNSQNRQDPVYATDRRGNSYVAGYRTYVWTRNEGNVSVTAALIRVSDGTTIYATPEPAWARVWAEGSPPKKDGHACVAEAADGVSSRLVETFAPVRKQIEVNPAKALRTATELYDNKWTYSDSFKATDEKMFVVVALPASCDRNRFRLAVVRKGQREDLASQDMQWDKRHSGFGYAFSPKQIADKAGPGDYEVKFYSGPEPVMRHAFRIR